MSNRKYENIYNLVSSIHFNKTKKSKNTTICYHGDSDSSVGHEQKS